jgi:hypothetical protein
MRRRVTTVLAFGAAVGIAASARADVRATVGEWGPVMTWPVSATHSILLPTGKVLIIGEFEEGVAQYLWTPGTTALVPTEPAGYNVFCGGHSRLADGRILFTGGHTELHVGLTHSSAFDPATESWVHLAPIRSPRWYPTNTTLANGDVALLSGEIGYVPDPNVPGEVIPLLEDLPDVYATGANAWRVLDGAVQRLTYYPWCFVARDARVFCVNQTGATFWLDPTGAGRWARGPFSLSGERRYGSPALIGSRVYITGGGIPPTDAVEVIDLADAQPTWRLLAPMTSPRRQHNATILPDETILVTGGTSGAAFEDPTHPVTHGELYDPATNSWTPLAATVGYHGYHSTALLLPDGRVLHGGGRFIHTVQVFSPPYLFRGPRPRIAHAPGAVSLGEPFVVGTPDAAAIGAVSLIRLGSVTHSYDQDQRLVPLSFTALDGALRVTAPIANSLAPPGDYMLFLVNRSGVPSEAAIVRVGQAVWDGTPTPGPPPPPPPPPDDGGGLASGSPSGGGCSSSGAGAIAVGTAVALAVAVRQKRRRGR